MLLQVSHHSSFGKSASGFSSTCAAGAADVPARGVPGGVTLEAGLNNDVIQRCAPLIEKFPNKGDSLRQVGQQLLFRPRRIGFLPVTAMAGIRRTGKGGQGLTEILENAAVIDDQTETRVEVLSGLEPGERVVL